MPEGWRTEKRRLPREVAQRFADYFAELMDSDVEWHFGGSYRRGAAEVGDLDIVVVTESGSLEGSLFEPPFVCLRRSCGSGVEGRLDSATLTSGPRRCASDHAHRRLGLHSQTEGSLSVVLHRPKGTQRGHAASAHLIEGCISCSSV